MLTVSKIRRTSVLQFVEEVQYQNESNLVDPPSARCLIAVIVIRKILLKHQKNCSNRILFGVWAIFFRFAQLIIMVGLFNLFPFFFLGRKLTQTSIPNKNWISMSRYNCEICSLVPKLFESLARNMDSFSFFNRLPGVAVLLPPFAHLRKSTSVTNYFGYLFPPWSAELVALRLLVGVRWSCTSAQTR